MPLDPDVIKEIVRDPQFQKLHPTAQVDTVRKYLAESEGDRYNNLPLGHQLNTAMQIIDYHTPGVFEKVGGMIPIAGPVIRAAYDPNQIRPWTRAAAGLLGADEAVKTPFGAASAEALREVAEFAALAGLAKPIGGLAGGLAERLVGNTAASKLGRGLVGAAGAEGAEQAMGAAAKLLSAGRSQELVERLTEHAITGGTIGALYGVADAVEHGELHPLQHLVVSPMFGAVMGVGFGGLAETLDRFGPAQAAAVVKAMQEEPDFQRAITEARPIVSAYAKQAGVPQADAGRVVTRALQGDLLTDDEFRVMRSVLTSDSHNLKTDAGLRILQTQKQHLEPSLGVGADAESGPLTITLEGPNRQLKQVVNPSPEQADRILADHYLDRHHIMPKGVTGDGAQDFIDRSLDPRDQAVTTDKVYPTFMKEAYRQYKEAHPSAPLTEKEFRAQFGSDEASNIRWATERARIDRQLVGETAGAEQDIEPGFPGLHFTPRAKPGAPGEQLELPKAAPKPIEAPPAGPPVPGQTIPAPIDTGQMRGAPQTFAEGYPTQAPSESPTAEFAMTLPGAQHQYEDQVLGKLKERLGPGYSGTLVQEQLAESVPDDLRGLLKAMPLTPPKGTYTGGAPPVVSAKPMLHLGAEYDRLPIFEGLRTLADQKRPATVGNIADTIGITREQARILRPMLIERGWVGDKGLVDVDALGAPTEQKLFAPPSYPKDSGSPVVYRGATGADTGTVLEDSGIAATVQTPTGETKVVVPAADGGSMEISKASDTAPIQTADEVAQAARVRAKVPRMRGVQSEVDALIDRDNLSPMEEDRLRDQLGKLMDRQATRNDPRFTEYEDRWTQLLRKKEAELTGDERVSNTGEGYPCQ